MAQRKAPPFRADHVGSLLRPQRLLDAREAFAQGRIGKADLRSVEDEAIRDIVRKQEEIGLQAVTDGEFRRTVWHVDFLVQLNGIVFEPIQGVVPGFKGTGAPLPVFQVRDRVRHDRPIMGPDFAFLKSVARAVPKVTIPAPSNVHFRGGRAAISIAAYPEMEALFADLVAAYRAEIADLAERGCRYLQIDEVNFAYLCDEKIRAHARSIGNDPEKLPALYVGLINDAIRERPKDMAVTMHVCRGNFKGTWMAEGGYDAVAEAVFGSCAVDGFFLEYDDERSGGFEPLRFVPKDKMVVLGLVTSKRPGLETKDLLKRRIDQAARHMPIENLAISPQCGFSSTVHGNPLTHEQQWGKLRLVAEVAREVWGTA